MKFSEMIEGLQILAKYEERGLEAPINGAEHDIVFAASGDFSDEEFDQDDDEYVLRDSRLTEADQARLVELGWHVDEDAESWAHYC
ncbi:MAG: hypothetical protein ACYCQK_01970 [Acidiferrobacteraceae bacterium]